MSAADPHPTPEEAPERLWVRDEDVCAATNGSRWVFTAAMVARQPEQGSSEFVHRRLYDALAAETATLRGELQEAIGKAARWQSACEEARAALAERGGEGEDEAEIAEARRMATIIEPTRMLYSNWRGETAQRRIIPIRLWLGSTEWHPEPGWLLRALDVDKDAMRDFALSDCTFRPATPSDHQRAVAEARPYPTNLSDEQLLAEWHDLDRLWHSGDIEGGGSPLEAIETQSESIEDEIKRRGITVPSALRHPEAGTGEGGTP